jgi:hypothetical protein
MKTLNQVKEAYRLADQETRLNLYLDCPELRSDFMAIELEQDMRRAPVPAPTRAVDRIDTILINLLNAFPLSWQTRLRRICCG